MKLIGKIFGGFNYFLYLCIVNKDRNFAPPREKFFSPTGEIKIFHIGADNHRI